MADTQVSQTQEDYLRAIYLLESKSKAPVRAGQLVDYMGLKKSTVTERVQDMANRKLVKYEKYSFIGLTKKGKEIAKKLTFKHRIIETFLFDFLKMKKKKVHEEAHRLEHAFSDEAIDKLYKMIGRPKTDPHGQTIKPA